MTPIRTLSLLFCLFALAACGGGDGGNNNNGTATFSVSETNVVLSGKQFEGRPPSQRIRFTYDTSKISIVSVRIAGDARTPSGTDSRVPAGERIFSTSSDSSGTFVDVMSVFTDIEGGTYTDIMTLEPIPVAGGRLPVVEVGLTLVQEPTVPIVAELDDPSIMTVEIVEGGPDIKIPATIIAGNTTEWSAGNFAYVADNGLMVLTADPAQGVGTEQVDLVLSPTPTLVDFLRGGVEESVFMSISDNNFPGNFTDIGFEVKLAE